MLVQIINGHSSSICWLNPCRKVPEGEKIINHHWVHLVIELSIHVNVVVDDVIITHLGLVDGDGIGQGHIGVQLVPCVRHHFVCVLHLQCLAD